MTSYDYDSAIDESGRPTPKYFLFRDAIAKATGSYAAADPGSRSADCDRRPLDSTSPPRCGRICRPFASDQLLTMEDLDQAYGYILYRTTVPGPVPGDLVLDELHDYAQIYANGKLARNARPPPRTESSCRRSECPEDRGSTSWWRTLAA